MKLHDLAALKPLPQHKEKAFTTTQIDGHLHELPGWSFAEGKIVKTYSFKNYYETIAFVNVVAAISHVTDHHPDLAVHYNRCVVAYNTHDVEQGNGGISINDFICAARIEAFVLQSASA
ncbi:MAG: 4a-hydroxytetrahydrobiopterin dehydratase [Casimicrobium sp.]